MKQITVKDQDQNSLRIESLGQLKELLEKPVMCRFEVDGQEIELPCRRLNPKTQEAVQGILREAQPPFKRERGPNGDYDYLDVKYLEKRDKNMKVARALVIYSGCPALAADRTGLTDAQQIYDFIQNGPLSETVLELISLTIQKGGIDVRERADFTSPPASEI